MHREGVNIGNACRNTVEGRQKQYSRVEKPTGEKSLKTRENPRAKATKIR